MMSRNLHTLNKTATRYLASATHAKPKQSSATLKSGEIQVSSLPSGAIVASIQSESPLVQIAVAIRAGARYEPQGQNGISHVLRANAELTTANYSIFGRTMAIDYSGSSLTVSGTRDTLTYQLESQNNDSLERNLDLFAETLAVPEFRPHELSDNVGRLKADLAVLDTSPQIQLSEALHQVAFKGGLRNSLYIPASQIGKFTQEQLQNYLKERFLGANTSVVGVGIPHDELLNTASAFLKKFGASQGQKDQSKFIGGEVHQNSVEPLTYVALATEGAGLKNTKDAVALALFQTILGPGQNYQIKNSAPLSQLTRLGRAVSGALGGKSARNVGVSAFSLNYEETGLFGINLIAPNSSDVVGLVKAAVKELRGAAGSVTEAELNDAKKNLKNSLLRDAESPTTQAYDLGNQLLLSGGSQVNLQAIIDATKAEDIKNVAGRLLKSKIALATIGSNAPYLDDIA